MLAAVPYLRLALAQINPCIGDFDGNADLILEHSRQAADAGADLAICPEMAVTGSPVEDLGVRDTFVDASRQAVLDIARRLSEAGLGELAVLVGYLDRTATNTASGSSGAPVSAAAVLHRGEIVCRVGRQATGGAAGETTSFGADEAVISVAGVDVAVAVDTDHAVASEPASARRSVRPGLLALITASPYDHNAGEPDQLIAEHARRAGCPVARVNCIGGQGELVFDGDSMIADVDGTIVARAPTFTESLEMADLELAPAQTLARDPGHDRHQNTTARYPISPAHPPPDQPRESRVAARRPAIEEIYHAVHLGLRDFLAKNRFERVVLGLSGGIDSALVATLACDAVGAEQVCGISNPSEISPQDSCTDAAELARRTGLELLTIPIAGMVDAFDEQLDLSGVAAENLQARVRGVIWMAESNRRPRSIVLACGNKSEGAVGYSTLYGDAVGGFAPIKDVPKSMVWQLASWRNDEATRRGETPPIPQHSIDKEPSAELRPGQRDTDSLPPYSVLDEILAAIEENRSRSGLVAQGFDPGLIDRVTSMVDAAEYKRRQYPPGTTISSRSSGHKRLPIASCWREGSR